MTVFLRMYLTAFTLYPSSVYVINAVINAASEVLREMAVDVLVDFLAGLPSRVDGKDCRHLLVLRLFFVLVAPIARIHKVDIRPIYQDSCRIFSFFTKCFSTV